MKIFNLRKHVKAHKKKCILAIFPLFYLLLFGTGVIMNALKNPLEGTEVNQLFSASAKDARILFDLTGAGSDGKRIAKQELTDTFLETIKKADDVIVIDMFLFNKFKGAMKAGFYRDSTGEVVEALLQKKRDNPELFIVFLTDPINSMYAHSCPESLKPLLAKGGHIVLTDADRMPESNPLIAYPVRPVDAVLTALPLKSFKFITNPLDPQGEKVGLLQILRLLRFKANHRKTLSVRTANGKWEAIVSSGNLHSASSAHSNVGFQIKGDAARGVLESELKTARSSAENPSLLFSENREEFFRKTDVLLIHQKPAERSIDPDGPFIQLCSESQTGDVIEDMLAEARENDRVDLAVFYLADLDIVDAVLNAARRGARIRILLDPNKDSFGRTRNGVPNRPVAACIMNQAKEEDLSVQIRWIQTNGEQAHFKFLHVYNENEVGDVLAGSSNFTIRNVRGSNLETVVRIHKMVKPSKKSRDVFERLWQNDEDAIYSVDFEAFAVRGATYHVQMLQTRLGNFTGLCTY